MGWLKLATLVFVIVATGGTPLRDEVNVELVRSEGDELEARVTWGDEGTGILINAKLNRLSIQSNRGEILIYGEKIDGSGTFYSVQGQSFFATETQESDGTLTKTEYAVPSSMEAEAKEAFKLKKIQRMLGSLDQSSARQSSERAIRELVQRPEIKILEETVRVLGERGVIGADNNGALLFYMTVMNMLKAKEGNTLRRSAERDRLSGESYRHGHRSLDSENEARQVDEEDHQEKDLCSPEISPSPSVKSDHVLDCTEVTRTILSTEGNFWRRTTHTRTYTYNICPTPTPTMPSVAGSCRELTKTILGTDRFLFLFTTTYTRTSTYTVCPTPTAAYSSPASMVISSPCIAKTQPKTSAVPCPSPTPNDYDPPSIYTADYHPNSTNRCAIPIPNCVHPCSENNSLLCENCHHNHECTRGRCPLVENCVGMCGRLCSCWSWLCGDCCLWDGCYQHDLECGRNFLSFACITPFNFRCNGY